MMITETTKQVIPFRPGDAKRVGDGCFYLDLIVWLNGDRIELGDRVGFNYGCYVNGYGGLTIGDDCMFGPYVMIHTANHELGDPTQPPTGHGWRDDGPLAIGRNSWVGMGACVLPGVTIGEGCVVGAGSVVADDLPPFTVAVGNPARVVRERDH
jgi:acetyltransferase-like isoleucine patch superfamily enzyme